MLVATPFAPYREAMVTLRFHSEDLVTTVTGPLSCRLLHLPATSDIMGKLRFAVRQGWGWTTPRAVLEALESLHVVPLPARCGFWAHGDGVAVEVVTRSQYAYWRRRKGPGRRMLAFQEEERGHRRAAPDIGPAAVAAVGIRAAGPPVGGQAMPAVDGSETWAHH